MSKIDLNEFKSAVPYVKKVIRKIMRVDVGTQNALDIVSASRGYPSYHSVKFTAELPYFDLRTNMGTKENPFFVTLDVGHFMTRSDADPVVRELLKGCQQFQKWSLYRNGEKTLMDYETKPEPERGLVYQIEVSGDTLPDVEMALEEVQSRIDNVMGFDRNETSSFSFRRAGEEYDFTEDTLSDMDIEQGPDGLIFDENGVILAKLQEMDDTGELDDAITDMGGRPEYGTKTLIGGASVPPKDVMDRYENEFDTETYHLFGMNFGEVDLYFKGNISDVVEHLKADAGGSKAYWIYEETGSSEPGSDDETFLEAVSGKVLPTDKYALIDDNGIVFSSDDEQKIEETFNFAHDDLENWEGTLYEAYQITPEQLLKARNQGAPGNFNVIVASKDDPDNVLRVIVGSPGYLIERCLIQELEGTRLMFFKEVRSL